VVLTVLLVSQEHLVQRDQMVLQEMMVVLVLLVFQVNQDQLELQVKVVQMVPTELQV
jgi:hypothetical protein